LIPTSDPSPHVGHFTSIQMRRAPEADFTLDGRRYTSFGHDWRVETVTDWLNSKVDLVRFTTPVLLQQAAMPATPRVALEHDAFADAVRQALRDYTNPDRLATNPLLQTRLIAVTTSEAVSPTILQALLRDAVATLQSNPRDLKFHRAIWHTYIEPAPTQEQAAERLGLPFNTYRYHLSQGIVSIIKWLWQRELNHPAH
jgi:hypothetical protein